MYNLSYILSTRNKYNFIKVTLNYLIKNVSDDEEIVVVDGGSTDGTKEYLEGLLKQNKINVLLSESDYGEAHGLNKGILLSKGRLIKFITDDDCYNFEAIALSKKYMLSNQHVDLLIGSTLNVMMENFSTISFQESSKNSFIKWLENKRCFSFTGLSMMLRRESLPLLGLLNSGTKFPDTEFSLRVTSLPINLAWCNAPVVIRVDNYRSNLRNYSDSILRIESDRIQYFYNKHYRKYHIFKLLQIKVRSLKSLISANNLISPLVNNIKITTDSNPQTINFSDFFKKCIDYFNSYSGDKEIICKYYKSHN
jgi:glycosyltransferase involved in cell wall biosynthesis